MNLPHIDDNHGEAKNNQAEPQGKLIKNRKRTFEPCIIFNYSSSRSLSEGLNHNDNKNTVTSSLTSDGKSAEASEIKENYSKKFKENNKFTNLNFNNNNNNSNDNKNYNNGKNNYLMKLLNIYKGIDQLRHESKIETESKVNFLVSKRPLDTGLISACHKGAEEAVKYLLEAGADPWSVDEDGYNAFYSAAEKGHTSVLKIFFQEKAKLKESFQNFVNFDLGQGQWKPLTIASKNGHAESVKFLLEAEANPYIIENDGFSGFYYAAQDGHTSILKAFQQHLKHDFLILVNFIFGKDQMTALMIASMNGHAESVKCLLKAGADPKLVNRSKFTSIYLAVRNGHISVIKAFQDHLKEDFQNYVDFPCGEDQRTALMCASYEGQAEVVRLLLKAGANHEVMSRSGYTAFYFAAESNHNSVLEVFQNHFKENLLNFIDFTFGEGHLTALMVASMKGHEKVVKFLLLAGANPNTVNEFGGSAFDCAVSYGRLAILKIFRKFLSSEQLIKYAKLEEIPRERSIFNKAVPHPETFAWLLASLTTAQSRLNDLLRNSQIRTNRFCFKKLIIEGADWIEHHNTLIPEFAFFVAASRFARSLYTRSLPPSTFRKTSISALLKQHSLVDELVWPCLKRKCEKSGISNLLIQNLKLFPDDYLEIKNKLLNNLEEIKAKDSEIIEAIDIPLSEIWHNEYPNQCQLLTPFAMLCSPEIQDQSNYDKGESILNTIKFYRENNKYMPLNYFHKTMLNSNNDTKNDVVKLLLKYPRPTSDMFQKLQNLIFPENILRILNDLIQKYNSIAPVIGQTFEELNQENKRLARELNQIKKRLDLIDNNNNHNNSNSNN